VLSSHIYVEIHSLQTKYILAVVVPDLNQLIASHFRNLLKQLQKGKSVEHTVEYFILKDLVYKHSSQHTLNYIITDEHSSQSWLLQ